MNLTPELIDETAGTVALVNSLTKDADAVKKAMKKANERDGTMTWHGNTHMAVLSFSERKSVDWAALCEKYGITDEQVAEFTTMNDIATIKFLVK